MNLPSITVCGPHLGFDPCSLLGGERFEASWLRAMDSSSIKFKWVVDSGLVEQARSLPNNHSVITLSHSSGFRGLIERTHAIRACCEAHTASGKSVVLRFHSVHYGAPIAVALRGLGLKCPMIFQHHHVEEPVLNYRIRSQLVRLMGAHFVCVSESSRSQLVALGIPRGKSTVVRSVHYDWDSRMTGVALRRAGMSAASYDLVFVGSLIPRKRPGLVLEAAARLNSLTGRRIRVAMIGRGPLLETLRRQAGELAVDATFFVDCDDPQKWEILRNSRIFLFPSSQEGFGYAPLEAALAGLWVVSSSCGSLPELLNGLPNAKCIPDQGFSATAIAECCHPLLDLDSPGMTPDQVRYWTDREAWKREHEGLILRMAAN